jgi:NTP pyrophosphatase (non-canonical NTP hydrolase)
MNYKEYLYCKLAEEAGEVAQAAMKANIFGEEGVNPLDVAKKTNLLNLMTEINDLVAVLELLHQEVNLPEFETGWQEHIYNKQDMIRSYWKLIKEKQG